jgi:hypothetical protein
MAATYEPIVTTTLTSAAADIYFGSLPTTYTDLRIVLVTQNATSGANLTMRLSGDTGSNYSTTTIFGNGSGAVSERGSNGTSLRLGASTTSIWSSYEINIFNYNSSQYKSVLSTANQDWNGSGSVRKHVGVHRATYAEDSIRLIWDSGNHAIGTTATLYGIKAA